MLSDEQRAGFDLTGILKLEGVFTDGEAARMRGVVWRELHNRYGIERDDPSTWDRHPPTRMRSSKKSHAFAPIFGPVLTDALDDLLGPGQWVKPKHYGQVLITMPNANEWRVPHRLWHADFGYQYPADDLFAVKYWAFFGEVGPGGGGTPQLAGSHRVTARYLDGRPPEALEYKRVRDGILRAHPWLRELSTPDDDPGRNARFLGADADLDGVPVRVVELTGKPGDVYLTHPWVMHSVAVNATDQPRLMRSVAIYRRDG